MSLFYIGSDYQIYVDSSNYLIIYLNYFELFEWTRWAESNIVADKQEQTTKMIS